MPRTSKIEEEKRLEESERVWKRADEYWASEEAALENEREKRDWEKINADELAVKHLVKAFESRNVKLSQETSLFILSYINRLESERLREVFARILQWQVPQT